MLYSIHSTNLESVRRSWLFPVRCCWCISGISVWLLLLNVYRSARGMNNAPSVSSYPEEPIYSELVFKSQSELDQTQQFSGQIFMPRYGSISLICLLINQSGINKRLVLVQDKIPPLPLPLPLPVRCKPPYPSPPSYSGPPAYPDFQLYDWDLGLGHHRQSQNNNLSSDSDYFSSSTYRANDNYKGKHYSPRYPSSRTDKPSVWPAIICRL